MATPCISSITGLGSKSAIRRINMNDWVVSQKMKPCLHRLGEYRGFIIHICHANAHWCRPCPRRMPFVDSNDHKLVHVVWSLEVQSLVWTDGALGRDGKIRTLNEIDDLGVGARVAVCCKNWSKQHWKRENWDDRRNGLQCYKQGLSTFIMYLFI